MVAIDDSEVQIVINNILLKYSSQKMFDFLHEQNIEVLIILYVQKIEGHLD